MEIYMPVRLIPSFLFLCFVNMITPGPANFSSLSAALNYGRANALRQWRGLLAGSAVICAVSVVTIYFIGNVIGDYVRYLSYIGAAYMLWLAYKTATSKEISSDDAPTKNCNFLTGFLLQMANVKVIVFYMTILATYVLPYSRSFFSLLIVGIFLTFTGPSCNLIWLFMGSKLRSAFQKHRRPLNLALGAALALSAVSLLVS